MADVILFFPSTGVVSSSYRMLPMSVMMVAAPLEARGYSVRIIDQRGNPTLLHSLENLYCRVVRGRVRRNFYDFMPELTLARGVQKALVAYRALHRGDSMD